MGDTGRLHCN